MSYPQQPHFQGAPAYSQGSQQQQQPNEQQPNEQLPNEQHYQHDNFQQYQPNPSHLLAHYPVGYENYAPSQDHFDPHRTQQAGFMLSAQQLDYKALDEISQESHSHAFGAGPDQAFSQTAVPFQERHMNIQLNVPSQMPDFQQQVPAQTVAANPHSAASLQITHPDHSFQVPPPPRISQPAQAPQPQPQHNPYDQYTQPQPPDPSAQQHYQIQPPQHPNQTQLFSIPQHHSFQPVLTSGSISYPGTVPPPPQIHFGAGTADSATGANDASSNSLAFVSQPAANVSAQPVSSTTLQQQNFTHFSVAIGQQQQAQIGRMPPHNMGPAMVGPPTRIDQPLPTTIMTRTASNSDSIDIRAKLQPKEGIHQGRRYCLSVPQQPIRARMCGFGDKDRRPITPPPCVLLKVFDTTTGLEIPANSLEPTYFILSVDLWKGEGTQEVSLVRHNFAAPVSSISTTSPVSFPPPSGPVYNYAPGSMLPPGQVPHPMPDGTSLQLQTQSEAQLVQQYGHPLPQQLYGNMHQPGPGIGGGEQAGALMSQVGFGPQGPNRSLESQNVVQAVQPQAQVQVQAQVQAQTQAQAQAQKQQQQLQATVPPQTGSKPGQKAQSGRGPPPPAPPPAPPSVHSASSPASQFTRNLIGSLTVNGFQLKDDKGGLGVWFIFQDLSVRTEGTFRLRFSFINVGSEDGGAGLMLMNRAPVLATVFSEPFQVYSAKKFPGVIESTPLSRMLASQGIKIPIRKDGNADGRDRRRSREDDD